MAVRPSWVMRFLVAFLVFVSITQVRSFAPTFRSFHTDQHPYYRMKTIQDSVQGHAYHMKYLVGNLVCLKSSIGDDSRSNHSHFDMDELQRRIDQVSNPSKALCYDISVSISEPRPTNVNVIMFKPDEEEECGIHCIECPQGSNNNIILAFETRSECDKFAEILKDQHFFEPVPQEINLQELETFCLQKDNNNNVHVQFIPKGIHIIPPTKNVKNLNHNPDFKDQQYILDYIYHINTSGRNDKKPSAETEGVIVVDNSGRRSGGNANDCNDDDHDDSNLGFGDWE